MTASEAPVPGDPQAGPAGRATSTVYRLLVVGILLAISVAPTVVLSFLIAPHPSNVPLVVASALFVGPGLSAALFALGERARDDGLAPAGAFLKGYRMNVGDVLKLWVPGVAVLAALTWTTVNIAVAGVPAWWAGILLGLAAVVVLWLVQATVITSFFAFRGRDTARLALYFLGRLPRVTLAVLSVLVLAGAVVFLTTPAVLAVFGALLVALLLRWEKPLLSEVRLRFVES
ncbi:glycosyltransferase [Isoptericola halotolerans]|uniref:glycosyltransferase n=1 Tax=Isoptericola halotolerans TaxID=300560 RepID=UPI00388D4E8F